MVLKPRDILHQIKKNNKKSCFLVLFFLSKKHTILSVHKKNCKSLEEIPTEEIIIPALYTVCNFVIIAKADLQNNQVALPTTVEYTTVKKIFQTLKKTNVQLTDYVLVHKDTYYSFHESKQL